MNPINEETNIEVAQLFKSWTLNCLITLIPEHSTA